MRRSIDRLLIADLSFPGLSFTGTLYGSGILLVPDPSFLCLPPASYLPPSLFLEPSIVLLIASSATGTVVAIDLVKGRLLEVPPLHSVVT